jgi:hypothetical protein
MEITAVIIFLALRNPGNVRKRTGMALLRNTIPAISK